MTEGHFRRSSDLGAINLDALIAAENDSGKRTLLLLLSILNTNIMANTSTTERVSNELAKHLEAFNAHVMAEEAIMNKGKGAWKVLAAVLAMAQIVISFALVTLLDKISITDHSITALQIENVRIQGALKSHNIGDK